MGVNPFAEVIDDEDPLSEEHCDGEEKWFPFGPSCNIHGKNVLCFVCSTENGSITSELLGNMLIVVFLTEQMEYCHLCFLMGMEAGSNCPSLSILMTLEKKDINGGFALAFPMG